MEHIKESEPRPRSIMTRKGITAFLQTAVVTGFFHLLKRHTPASDLPNAAPKELYIKKVLATPRLVDEDENELDSTGDLRRRSCRHCVHTTQNRASVGFLKIDRSIVSTQRPVRPMEQGNDPRLLHSCREPSKQPTTLQSYNLR
jgi:hypothetical protein